VTLGEALGNLPRSYQGIPGAWQPTTESERQREIFARKQGEALTSLTKMGPSSAERLPIIDADIVNDHTG